MTHEANSPAAAPLDPAGQVVIVGAGLAGLRVATTLRDEGFAGGIVVLSDEPELPYDRPPLSKAVLLEPGAERTIALADPNELAAQAIDLRCGATVAAIRREARCVELDGGALLAYDRLVLATGSSVRIHPLLPLDRPGVHYLRTMGDALALREAAAAAQRVVIVGGGVIGLEVAAALAEGRQVTVIDPAERVMCRSASVPVSDRLAARHRAAGVALRLGRVLADVRADGDGLALTLDDGTRLVVDLVVVGIGVVPNVALAVAAGLDAGAQGIMVDAEGRTSDPAIAAAGEVACYPGRDGQSERQETWAHAALHAEHVARALLGPSRYDALPSYWSDQFDLSLTVVGTPIASVDVVRGDPAGDSFLVFHVEHDRVVGVSAINAARDLRQARRLIGRTVSDATILATGALAPLVA